MGDVPMQDVAGQSVPLNADTMAGIDTATVRPAAETQVPAPPDSSKLVPGLGAPAPEGSFSAKLATALGAVANSPSAPSVLNTPGGWSKLLLSASLDAMSNKTPQPAKPNVVQGVRNALENFAAGVNAPAPEGQGAVSGFAAGIGGNLGNARAQHKAAFDEDAETQRLDMEQKRNSAAIAASNAQMLHSQALLHSMQGSALDSAITSGQRDFDTIQKAPQHGAVVEMGIDSDKIQSMLQNKSFNPTEETAYLVGKQLISGTENDAEGPKYRGLYNIVKLPPSVNITDQVQADRLFGKDKVKVDEKHPMVIPGAQFNLVSQQADDKETATAALQKAADETAIAAGERKQKVEAVDFNGAGVWVNALSAAMRQKNLNGTPIDAAEATLRAYNALVQNPPKKADGSPMYPNLTSDIKAAVGEKLWNSMIEQQQKASDRRVEDIAKMKEKMQEAADQANQQLGNIGTVMTDAMAAQIAALPKDKKAVLQSAPAAIQPALLAAAFGPGDQSLDVFPTSLRKGAPGLNKATALSVIKQLNPNWSEQQYKLTSAAYKDITQGKDGAAIQMYNNVLGHADEAYKTILDANRNAPKLWNTALNALEKNFGGETATKIQTALLPVKGEISLLLAGGYKPGQEEQNAFDQVLSPSSTPGQINAALKIIGAVGAVRLGNINDRYKSIAGKNIPGILTQDSIEAAKHLDLDPTTMQRLGRLNVGDTLFHDPSYVAPTQQQAAQQQSEQNAKTQAQNAAASVHPTWAVGMSPVNVNGQIVGYSSDGGKTMRPVTH
jgi:hypothetical protein